MSPPTGVKQERHSSQPWPGQIIVALLGLLLVYTTWAWAGLRPSFHVWGNVLACVLLAGIFGAGGRRIGRDPVFWIGLLFLGYLGLQWLNSGRVQYFDVGYQRWMYTRPPWPGWPSSFCRSDARQMLAWFFPAWVIAVALRAQILNRHAVRKLLMLVVCNAGVLALFGVIQYATRTQAIFWVQPLKSHFFAVFAYGNHTAPFFVLTGGMGFGLLYREVFDTRITPADTPSAQRLRHPGRVAVLALMVLLSLVGAYMGFSRTGVILAVALGLFALGYGWRRGWTALPAAGRLNLVAVSLGAAGLLYFIVAGFGAGGIRKEFTLVPVAAGEQLSLHDRVFLELGGRPRYAQAAVKIWRENAWFGVGGWGYKYLVASHVPENQWAALEKRGWANVHVDFLQFLVEFGLVGTGLLMAALGVMVHGLHPFARRRPGALYVMGLSSLGLTILFSFVDIPFRCPAILYTWVTLLAAIPVLCPFSSPTSQLTTAHPERTNPTGG